MTAKYGFSLDKWKQAKKEMKDIIVERAKLRGLIPYSELADKIKSVQIRPESYAFAAMLGEISTERR